MNNTGPWAKQPGRPSYNMLFAYFKQQGYSDELAASESRRLMMQTTGSNSTLPGASNPTSSAAFNQPPTSGFNSTYDRRRLLCGVKIPPKQFSDGWQIPISTTPMPSHRLKAKHIIPITLKISKNRDRKSEPCPPQFDDIRRSPAIARVPGDIPKQFSSDMAIDVTTEDDQPPEKAHPDAPVPTMDDINNWIQRLYAHHSMGACSRVFRAKISEYVERIVKRHRSGSLTTNDLVIPSSEEILGKGVKVPKSSTALEPKRETQSHTVDSGETKSEGPGDAAYAKKSNPVPVLHGVDCPKLKGPGNSTAKSEGDKKQNRLERFKNVNVSHSAYNFRPQKGVAVVGVCETLEKPYLRLTAEPNPATVRPEPVLRRAFRHVFDTFMRTSNYRYIEEQFRSIRQDIQVQHLRSPFVVKLYATNARVALVHGDLDQFNQCQTQLRHLHRRVEGFPLYQKEFDCYFLLYLALQNMQMDVLRYLRGVLRSEFRRSAYFRYANSIRGLLSEGDFVEYFKVADTGGIDTVKCLEAIYNEAFSTEDFSEGATYHSAESLENEATVTSPPFFTPLLFKMFEPRFRMNALVAMSSTAMSLSLGTIKEALRFNTMGECESFIRDNGGVLTPTGNLDCKQSLGTFLSSPLLRNKKQ